MEVEAVVQQARKAHREVRGQQGRKEQRAHLVAQAQQARKALKEHREAREQQGRREVVGRDLQGQRGLLGQPVPQALPARKGNRVIKAVKALPVQRETPGHKVHKDLRGQQDRLEQLGPDIQGQQGLPGHREQQGLKGLLEIKGHRERKAVQAQQDR
jgi:hypothetical protein